MLLMSRVRMSRRVCCNANLRLVPCQVWPRAVIRTSGKTQVQAQLTVIREEMLAAAMAREEVHERQAEAEAEGKAARELRMALEMTIAATNIESKEVMRAEVAKEEEATRDQLVEKLRREAEVIRAVAVAEAEVAAANATSARLTAVHEAQVKAAREEVETLERKAKLSEKMLAAVVNQKTAA